MAHFTLVCRRCGIEGTYRLPFRCDACDGPLDVRPIVDRESAISALRASGPGVWRYEALLPSPAGDLRPSLGEGETPLLRLDRAASALEMPGLLLKNEAANPTQSYKDRYQAASLAHGAALGCAGCVCASTGNSALAAAAYAAHLDLPCRIFCHPETPEELCDQMRALGARVEVADAPARETGVRELVAQGWYPSIGSSFVPLASPFGIEGYKTIAYELVRQCGGSAPDWVLCPTAGGDGLVGVWRGFIDLHELGLISRLPRMVACQPSGANPVAGAFAAGLAEPLKLEKVSSVALSIRDPVAGSHVLPALRESGGLAVSVEDEEIIDAARLLASCGLLVEPASAAAVAGARRLAPTIGEARAVCLLTATGARWPLLRSMLRRGVGDR
jgi:threonine synthase